MSGTSDEGWDDDDQGTAVAGPAYMDALAKSEPEFESEAGTAVAGSDYVENIRKSAVTGGATAAPTPAAPAPAPAAKPAFAPRSPTKAFGTPVMLRAPAALERRTGHGLPGVPPRENEPNVPPTSGSHGARGAPAAQPRAGMNATTLGIPAIEKVPAVGKPAPAPTPATVRSTTPAAVPVIAVPAAVPTPIGATDEDEEADDLDTFRARYSVNEYTESVAIENITPVPPLTAARPMRVDPDPMGETSPALPKAFAPTLPHDAVGHGAVEIAERDPIAIAAAIAASPAPAPSFPHAPHPSHAALPVTYPVVSDDARQPYLSPLTSPIAASSPTVEPVANKSRKRSLLIGAVIVGAIALGVGAAFALLGGPRKSSTPASMTHKPDEAAKPEAKPEPTQKTDLGATTTATTPAATTPTATTSAATTPTATTPAATTPETTTDKPATPAATPPAITTTDKPATSTPAATTTTKAPVRKAKKAAKRPVAKKKKRPVRKPAAKAKPACTDLDCL